MKSAFSKGFLLKNLLLHSHYSGFDGSGRIVLIESEILITTGMVWLVSSDKRKASLFFFSTYVNTIGDFLWDDMD